MFSDKSKNGPSSRPENSGVKSDRLGSGPVSWTDPDPDPIPNPHPDLVPPSPQTPIPDPPPVPDPPIREPPIPTPEPVPLPEPDPAIANPGPKQPENPYPVTWQKDEQPSICQPLRLTKS